MILIVYQKEENIFLEIDGKNIFDSIDFRTKSNLLENAINSLQNDITETADKFKTNRFYHLYWCHTYLPHRDDGLRGTVLEYYFIELVKYVLSKNKKITAVVFKSYVPAFLVSHLNSDNTIIFQRKVNYKSVIKNYLRKYVPVKRLLQYLKSSIVKTHNVNNFNFNGSILFFSSIDSITRFKGFTSLFKEQRYIIDVVSLSPIIDLNTNKQYEISLFELKHFAKAFIKTIKFQYSKKKSIKTKPSNFFMNYIREQNFLQSYFVLLRQEALNNFVKKYKFNCIVTRTNFGDPLRWQIISILNKFNHKTINFACRSMYSYLRAEDNAIKPDFYLHDNNSSLPDYHIIFDKVSFKHLVNLGIDTANIYHFNSPIKVNKRKEVKDGILLLLAHHDYNEKLINMLNEFKSKDLNFNKIYYREHPNVTLSLPQIKRLNQLSENTCNLTNYYWHEISISNTICFTSNSTSAIDALSVGAGVLWLPFFSILAIQFEPIMKLVGNIIYSKKDFYLELRDLQENEEYRKVFMNKCKTEYNKNFRKDDKMLEFTEELINNL